MNVKWEVITLNKDVDETQKTPRKAIDTALKRLKEVGSNE